MGITKSFKIYGQNGHRQKESFNDSYRWDFSEGKDIRVIEVLNSDKTNTNEYSIVRITRNTAMECIKELNGQISDGIFENCCVGQIVEIL